MTDGNDELEQSVASITESWLHDARLGDAHAWSRLSQTYGRLVGWWARRGGVPDPEVADIIQEVFVAVQRGLTNYRHESFRGWLWTIAKRKIQDYWRGQERVPRAPGGSSMLDLLNQIEADSTVAGQSDQATKILFDEIVATIKGEFRELDWQAFWRTVVEGQPAAEVARALDVSRNVVYLAASRIRRRIREEFGESLGGESQDGERQGGE